MRTQETQGEGKDRRDCMRKFTASWDRFCRRRGQPDRIHEREAQAALMYGSNSCFDGSRCKARRPTCTHNRGFCKRGTFNVSLAPKATEVTGRCLSTVSAMIEPEALGGIGK